MFFFTIMLYKASFEVCQAKFLLNAVMQGYERNFALQHLFCNAKFLLNSVLNAKFVLNSILNAKRSLVYLILINVSIRAKT